MGVAVAFENFVLWVVAAMAFRQHFPGRANVGPV